MTSPSTNFYPDKEFLKDLLDWKSEVENSVSPHFQDTNEAATHVFSTRYLHNEDQFLFRLTRFLWIVHAIQGNLGHLLADRIARKKSGTPEEIPISLPLALLAWSRSLSDDEVDSGLDPNWPWILMEFDRLEQHQ